MNLTKMIGASAFLWLSIIGMKGYTQEAASQKLLATYLKEVKFSPATDLPPQEIELKINAINPYTLYRKGSVAEYAFERNGQPVKFKEGPFYIQQIVADERIENGLLVAYVQHTYLNKNHQPMKMLPKDFKSYYYPTEIDTAGTFHLTHDINRGFLLLKQRQGYAMLVPSNLKVGDALKCGTIKDKCKPSINFTSTYSDFKVVGEERITTPAGSFDCLKLTGTITEKMSGIGGYDSSYFCQWWIARGIGFVRYEIYDGKHPFIIYLNKIELK